MISANFDIHGVLKIKFRWKKYRAMLRDLDLKLNYFFVEDLNDPDIIVEIGPFKPNLVGCRVYERRFFVKEGFVYGVGGSWRTKWSVQIDGLDKDRLFMNIDGKLRSIRGLLAPNMLVSLLVLPLLEFKFFNKGYLLLHSGAVSKDGRGYLIVGRGGSAKTSIVMDLIRKYGYEYIGDDRVLVGSGIVLSFPTHIQTFEYLLNNAENEFMNFYEKLRLIAYLLKDRQVKLKIAEKSLLAGVLFIIPSTKPYTVKCLNTGDATKKMVANMLMEHFETLKIVGLDISPTFECFTAYSAAYPNSSVAKFQENLLLQLESLLSELPIYEISIPLKYDEEIARIIDAFIEREIG
jgi:hypothetical protein